MWYLKCAFFLTFIYFQCSAFEKNPDLDQLKGTWMIRNTSKNALTLTVDCSSVQIEPTDEKSSGGNGTILFKVMERSFMLTVSLINQSYQIYYPELSNEFPLANVTILKITRNKFFVAEIQSKDDVYYGVFINQSEPSQGTDAKVKTIWNSLPSIRDIPLYPIEQDNCEESSEENDNNLPEISSERSRNPILITIKGSQTTSEELNGSTLTSSLKARELVSSAAHTLLIVVNKFTRKLDVNPDSTTYIKKPDNNSFSTSSTENVPSAPDSLTVTKEISVSRSNIPAATIDAAITKKPSEVEKITNNNSATPNPSGSIKIALDLMLVIVGCLLQMTL